MFSFRFLLAALTRLPSYLPLHLIQPNLITMMAYFKAHENIPPRSRPLFLLNKATNNVYLVVALARCLIVCCGMLKYVDLEGYYKFDPLVKEVPLKLHFFDPYLVFAFSLTILFGIYIDYDFYFKLRGHVLAFLHQLICANSKQFFELNASLQFHLRMIKSPRLVVSFIQRYRDIISGADDCRKIYFALRKLSLFRHLSANTRVRLVLLVLATNVNICISLLAIGTAHTLIFYAFIRSFSHTLTWLQLFFVILDALFNIYNMWNSNRLSMFGINYVAITIFANSALVEALNRKLTALIHQCKTTKRSSAAQRKLATALAAFRLEHSQIIDKTEQLNRSMASPLLFVALGTQFGFNVWLTTFLLLRSAEMLAGERVYFYVLLAIQMTFVLLICKTFVGTSILQCSHRVLYQAQTVLGPEELVEKFKLAAYYEKLNSRRKFCFTFGPVGNLSKKSIMKFLIAYSVYLMTSYSIVYGNVEHLK